MKYLKLIVIVLLLVALSLALLVISRSDNSQQQPRLDSANHIYATWDTMEFDKCVAAWLIVRFIDKDAKFVFHPQGTEITEGVVFDVPGAKWSRQHRKCTSQCILETLTELDPAIEEIVSIAAKIELNRWQLDRWPKAQKCFNEVKEITDSAADPLECFEKTRPYFDELYSTFKEDDI